MKTMKCVLLGLLWLSQHAAASSICAVIGDPEGRPVPGASIRVLDLMDSNIQFTADADNKGQACAGHVPDGTYSVEAAAGGFMYVRDYPVRVAFPEDVHLSFQLPFGEIREGLGMTKAILSGTLKDRGKPADGVKVCAFEIDKSNPVACTTTNDLGQYALTLPPRTYTIKLSRHGLEITSLRIDLPTPAYYRNKLAFPASNRKQQ